MHSDGPRLECPGDPTNACDIYGFAGKELQRPLRMGGGGGGGVGGGGVGGGKGGGVWGGGGGGGGGWGVGGGGGGGKRQVGPIKKN